MDRTRYTLYFTFAFGTGSPKKYRESIVTGIVSPSCTRFFAAVTRIW